ncbi:MAG: PD-(D/E)XK nuclease family protein, partial [Actinomycetota bacterium]|nr:PD-(D/E)XK nuclease family protein [Actinomycetota bacterium]
LKHAYRYGLGIHSAGGVHAALGTLVHAVLARFLDPRRPGPRTRERLLGVAEELWSDDLAPYRPQLEEARRDLYDMLELWWEKEGSLGDAGPDVLATERAFAIPVGPHQVLGRIDRLDSDEQGGVRVVDYKTGKKRPRQADVADDLQLATYRLAALRDPDLAAWGSPTAVRILHLRSMDAFDQPAGPEHPGATEARILSTAERILAEDREPAVDADCDRCELHRLCPLWPEGREVGQP